MCGPFAILASHCDKRNSSFVAASAYSAGRLATYVVIGLMFGALGMALNFGSSFASMQQLAAYLAGGLMIAVGLVALARHFGLKIKLPTIADHLQTFLQNNFKRIDNRPRIERAVLIGALTCLMPCGWLYTFAIVAAGTGHPVSGALVMFAFWGGTFPVMFGLPLGIRKLSASIQKRVPIVMASCVILIGLFTIAVRAPVNVGGAMETDIDSQNLVQQVRKIDQSQLPCCHGED